MVRTAPLPFLRNSELPASPSCKPDDSEIQYVANYQLKSDWSGPTDRSISRNLNELTLMWRRFNVLNVSVIWHFICTCCIQAKFNVLNTTVVRSC